VLCVCVRVTGCYIFDDMVHQFFGCLCRGRSMCLGDGIMFVWHVCYIGCWCIAGVCNCVPVSLVVVCDIVIYMSVRVL